MQVKRGNIKVEKFKEFDTPTGVKNYYYSKNIHGGKIDLKHKDVLSVTKRYLNKKQSNRIKRFAVKDYNK